MKLDGVLRRTARTGGRRSRAGRSGACRRVGTDWKPHEKSMPLGYLATLVATHAVVDRDDRSRQDELDLEPAGGAGLPAAAAGRRTPSCCRRTTSAWPRALAGAARRDRGAPATTPWRLLVAGQASSPEQPRHVVIEDSFAHLAHHRGQLTVYLRLNDALVPSIYGPSADDKSVLSTREGAGSSGHAL